MRPDLEPEILWPANHNTESDEDDVKNLRTLLLSKMPAVPSLNTKESELFSITGQLADDPVFSTILKAHEDHKEKLKEKASQQIKDAYATFIDFALERAKEQLVDEKQQVINTTDVSGYFENEFTSELKKASDYGRAQLQNAEVELDSAEEELVSIFNVERENFAQVQYRKAFEQYDKEHRQDLDQRIKEMRTQRLSDIQATTEYRKSAVISKAQRVASEKMATVVETTVENIETQSEFIRRRNELNDMARLKAAKFETAVENDRQETITALNSLLTILNKDVDSNFEDPSEDSLNQAQAFEVETGTVETAPAQVQPKDEQLETLSNQVDILKERKSKGFLAYH
jgi:hypothetical protein